MRRSLPAAVVGAAFLLAAAQIGYMCSRSQLGQLQAELDAEKRARVESPSPSSEGRAKELEELRGQLRQQQDTAQASRGELTAARQQMAAERSRLIEERDRLGAERDRLARELASLQHARSKPASPAAGAAPAAAPQPRPPAPVCPPLGEPSFELRELDTPLSRLGGRLVLEIERAGAGLALRLDPNGAPHVLGDLPQRFAFDCAGTAYVVSVCEASREPLAVRGRVTRAEEWRHACP